MEPESEANDNDGASQFSHASGRFFVKHRVELQFLAAAVLLYAGTDLWQNLSWPVFYSNDETLEIDYVYRLTLGQLPEFFDGQQYNPLNQLSDRLISVQWRYQHPPLFYILEVPVFLLFHATTNPVQAIWAMRALVFVLGVSLILVSAWAARWILGTNNPLTALVPFFVAANRCLGSVVFNYTLATLWVVLLTGMTAKLIRSLPHETSRSSVIAWTAIVLLAPLTRLSTVPVAGLCLVMLAVALIVNRQITFQRCFTLLALPTMLAVASSAWFYIRLYRLSGSVTGSQPEWSSTHLQRNIHASFADVLGNPSFWKNSFSQYQNQSTVSMSQYAWVFLAVLILIPLGLGLVALLRRCIGDTHRRQPISLRRADMVIALLLVGTLAGTIIQQVLFVKQGGSDNAVYFSLVNILFAVLIAAGFLQFRGGTRVALLTIWLTARVAAMMYEAQLRWPVTSETGSLETTLVYASLIMMIFAVIWASALNGSCRDIQFSLD